MLEGLTSLVLERLGDSGRELGIAVGRHVRLQLTQLLTRTLEEDIAIPQILNPCERHDNWLFWLIVKAYDQVRELLTHWINEQMVDLAGHFVSGAHLCATLQDDGALGNTVPDGILHHR